MEVRKVSTSSAPYQGSGPEVPVKQEAVTRRETSGSPEASQAEKKMTLLEPVNPEKNRVSEKNGVSEKTGASGEEKQNPIEAQEMAKKKNSMKRAVEEVNRKAKNSELIFGIHDATNRVTIKVVDKGTKEIIREFPPEETLDMIAKVWELAGIMIDERG